MKNKLKGRLFFYIVLVCIFLVLSFLLVLIIRGEHEKNRLLSQYEAERMVFDIGTSLRQDIPLEEAVGNNVLGFGVYDSQGKTMQRWGSAPQTVPLIMEREMWESHFSFNKDEKTLVLMKEVGMHPDPRKLPPGEKNLPHEKEEDFSESAKMPADRASPTFSDERIPRHERPRFFYLEMSTQAYWKKERMLSFTLFGLLSFLAGAMILIQHIYKKNREYKEKLEQQKQLVHLGEAARTLSHEIKNPLSAIRVRTGILKKLSTEETAEDLKIIEEEIDRLRLLTERVGEFIKNPQGEPETIELDQFTKDILTRFSSRIHYENHCTEKCFVVFDRERLRSAIENLINNAIESDLNNRDIVVHLSSTKDRVTISILDNGKGIPPEIQEVVFDPFFTTKTNGSGIGLSITRRFIEAAGGTITLVPRHPGGTEAKIILRRKKG